MLEVEVAGSLDHQFSDDLDAHAAHAADVTLSHMAAARS
jgi:hypothetical protein